MGAKTVVPGSLATQNRQERAKGAIRNQRIIMGRASLLKQHTPDHCVAPILINGLHEEASKHGLLSAFLHGNDAQIHRTADLQSL
jgi:hypothetical protein